MYGSESEAGEAIRAHGTPREELKDAVGDLEESRRVRPASAPALKPYTKLAQPVDQRRLVPRDAPP
jgi:hypothetical protein